MLRNKINFVLLSSILCTSLMVSAEPTEQTIAEQQATYRAYEAQQAERARQIALRDKKKNDNLQVINNADVSSNATGKMEEAAGKSGALQQVAQIVFGVAAGECCSQNYYACAVAVAAIGVTMSAGQAQGGANYVGSQYDPNSANYGANNPSNITDPGVNVDPFGNSRDSNKKVTSVTNPNGSKGPDSKNSLNADASALTKILNDKLAKSGMSIDSGAGLLKLPNGKTVPLNGSPADYKAAGGDPAAIDKTVADMAKIEADVAKKLGASGNGVPTVTFGNPGGGSGGGRGGAAGGGTANAGFDLNSLMNGNRKPAAIQKQGVAGLSRKLGNENIGVQGDNIFEMVNRRYRDQDKQNAFLREK